MSDGISVELLADHPTLLRAAGLLGWAEWGCDDPSPDEWIEMTAREAGRDDLPVTLAAQDHGHDHTWVVTGGDAVDYYRACG